VVIIGEKSDEMPDEMPDGSGNELVRRAGKKHVAKV
jgi:hypothetical protein